MFILSLFFTYLNKNNLNWAERNERKLKRKQVQYQNKQQQILYKNYGESKNRSKLRRK